MIRTTQIAALITGIWITSTAQAQSNAPAPTPAPAAVQAPPTSRPSDGWRQVPLEAMNKHMKLSPEQLEKIKAIEKEYTAKHDALNKTSKIEEQRMEAGKLMSARDAAINAELNTEQKAAFQRVNNPTGSRLAAPAPATTPATAPEKK
jgi:hypothetical protein